MYHIAEINSIVKSDSDYEIYVYAPTNDKYRVKLDCPKCGKKLTFYEIMPFNYECCYHCGEILYIEKKQRDWIYRCEWRRRIKPHTIIELSGKLGVYHKFMCPKCKKECNVLMDGMETTYYCFNKFKTHKISNYEVKCGLVIKCKLNYVEQQSIFDIM